MEEGPYPRTRRDGGDVGHEAIGHLHVFSAAVLGDAHAVKFALLH